MENDDNLDARLTVRIASADAASIRQFAAYWKMSMSDLLREWISRSIAPERGLMQSHIDFEEEGEAIYQSWQAMCQEGRAL